MKILFLEDDPILGETIYEMLIESGYKTTWVLDGDAAAEAAYKESYDLYIFDINVPEIDGFDLVEYLRSAEDRTPVIFISAMSDISAISKGFLVGAEDYIKKPFYPQELLLRIEARFLRQDKILEFKNITFSFLENEVKREGKVLSLGSVQSAFLKLFISNIGRTISKESLFELMEYPSQSALRVAINKLKQTTGWDIQNIRGVGYRIEKS